MSTAPAVSWPRRDGQSAQQPESSVVEEATNLVALVPEADDGLAASNMLLPRDKRLTAPAHITLVYPFLPSGAAVAASAEMESFFASLKKELTHGETFATREEARASIFEYIEVFYNRSRLHSSLGYLSPAEFEKGGTMSEAA